MKPQNEIDSPRNPWIIFSVVAMGTFMGTLDASIVNVALPVMTKIMGTDIHISQWIVTAYLLTISSLLPIFGRAGDMYGQRRILTSGVALFTISSVACAFSSSIIMLIVSRIVQAVGASMMMSNGPAIIAMTFSVKERGRALGAIGTVVALGSVTGPALGGLLVGIFGWHSIFLINIPIGIIAFTMGRVLLPKGIHKDETFDFAGSLFFAISIISILLVLSHGGKWGWQSIQVFTGISICIVSFILFFSVEMKVKHPMLDLSMFRNQPFLVGNISGLLSFIAMFSNVILLPFFLINIKELTPSQVGLIITPFPLVMGITAPLSGYLSEKISPVYLTTIGLSITSAGLAVMSYITGDTSILYIALLQAFMGLGSGLFQSPNNNSVISSVPREKMGIAGGINALMRNFGMVTGTAAAVSIFDNRRIGFLQDISNPTALQTTAAFLHGYHTAIMAGAVVAAIGAVISMNRKGHSVTENK